MQMSQRIKMPERAADIRNKDFEQVNTGYTHEQMLTEAARCLNCPKPKCVTGCPVEVNIPGFIKPLSQDNPGEAIKILKEKSNLPAVCGRVCPQEKQCEKLCVLGIKGESVAIGNLERYAADWGAANVKETVKPQSNGIKVAVVGSGPAGLTCGGDLAKMGFEVSIFESLHNSGGVLRYGIPEFRLPKESVLDVEVNGLKALGAKLFFNTLVGRTITIEELFEQGFKAIFVGTGAGLPTFMGIEGENLKNIYSANEFLVRVNLMRGSKFPEYDTPIYKGRNVVVIGGGNTAMDSVRTAKRLGANSVKLVYRRSEEEMPARLEERIHAKEEGVEFVPLTNPVKFIADDKNSVAKIECVKMELGEPDASGRRKPREVAGSNFVFDADVVVLALGLNPNPILTSLTKGLKTDEKGRIIVDENLMSSIKGIFAGGDIAGGSTVIQAMGMGKQAARSIAAFLGKA
jgi:glutamate synthase (NADPH/NADH) small chain